MLGAVFESGLNAMEMGRAVWFLWAFESDVSALHFFLLKVSLSVYLLVFGYLYKEDEVGVGCWLSYQFCVAVLCSNAVVQGHMVSVVQRSQVRDSCNLYIYSCKLPACSLFWACVMRDRDSIAIAGQAWAVLLSTSLVGCLCTQGRLGDNSKE